VERSDGEETKGGRAGPNTFEGRGWAHAERTSSQSSRIHSDVRKRTETIKPVAL